MREEIAGSRRRVGGSDIDGWVARSVVSDRSTTGYSLVRVSSCRIYNTGSAIAAPVALGATMDVEQDLRPRADSGPIGPRPRCGHARNDRG